MTPARHRPDLLLALALLSVPVPALSQRAAPDPAVARAPIDWAAFLQREDPVWDRVPEGWGGSVFIGNGNLGATIDEHDGAFGWTINRTDVAATDVGYGESRFPIGRVLLRTAGSVTGGDARIGLWNAEGSGTLRTDRGAVRWRSFTAADPSVIAIVLDCGAGEEGCALDWSPAAAVPPRKVHNRLPLQRGDLHPPPVVRRGTRETTSVQRFRSGGAHAESILRGADGPAGERVYYVSIGFDSTAGAALAQARAATGSAAREGLARLTMDHRRWWHDYYPESFLSIPDPRLEQYYWIQVYKLGSAMRADGPILDLAGPWFRDTPWPRIWWNLNIQLTYSPLFTANRLGLAESLFRNLDLHRQALIDNVPPALRDRAAGIGRASGADLVRPVDLAHAGSDAAHEMGDLPWTLYYYWLDYRERMDDAYLRERVYPLLRRAIGNYLAYVEKGPDGKYHLPPTLSPELAVVPDANYDLALLRWGLQTLVESAEHLKLDDPMLPRWRELLVNLTPPPTDSLGLMVGRGHPWSVSHRHYSHLLGVFPLALINPDVPGDSALIQTSLHTWERDPSLFRGYSFTGAASMYAMLGEGDSAVVRLHRFLDFPKYNEPNTFYAEAGPVIETPLSAATSVQDLLLQSWGGALRVFPGVPAAWREAAFDDLRGQGAFLVSAVRHDGHTAWVKVQSLAGAPCTLVVRDWTGAVVRSHTGALPTVRADGHGRFTIALARGASVVLAPDAGSPLPPLAPAPGGSDARSYYPDWSRTGAQH